MEGVGDHHPDRGQRDLLSELAYLNEAVKKTSRKAGGANC